jgi:hypothetical protein
MTRCAAAMFALAVVAGCAIVDPAQQDAIVGEALRAARGSSPEQKSELTKARQEFLKDPSDSNRVRLATLLALLPAPLRNDARAIELLEPLADPASPGFGRFAALLSAQISERQRLARELEHITRERARAEREHEQTDKERDKREEALRQQLEALRSIERGILEREDRLRRRQR